MAVRPVRVRTSSLDDDSHAAMTALLQRNAETFSVYERFIADRVSEGCDPQEAVTLFLNRLPAQRRRELRFAWHAVWARPNQRIPDDDEWDTLFARAGRGYGKTRFGAEGTRRLVVNGRAHRVMIIGSTAADARDVMIEGDSGILAVHPPQFRPLYEPSKRLLTWPNGAIGLVRSAEEPDGCRGPNTDLVWGDEPASWKTGSAAWDNAMLGNRLGKPHSILTGTPRPIEWLRKIEQKAGTIVRTGSTYENIANLAPKFIALILDRYEGTRLGQQELHAEYLDDVEGALWRLATIEASRAIMRDALGHEVVGFDRAHPWESLTLTTALERRLAMNLGTWTVDPRERRPWVIKVGVDPPAETAECGIIVAAAPRNAKYGRDHCIVLDDATVEGPPEVWGAAVAAAYHRWNAAEVIVERNQGGDMTRSTIHAADPSVIVEKVTASQSKADRAEPVSTAYSKGWVHHAGYFGKLESQQTTWVPNESKSPDRLDALVHVLTNLLKISSTRMGAVGNPAAPRR